jgi:hypothetical protein
MDVLTPVSAELRAQVIDGDEEDVGLFRSARGDERAAQDEKEGE